MEGEAAEFGKGQVLAEGKCHLMDVSNVAGRRSCLALVEFKTQRGCLTE